MKLAEVFGSTTSLVCGRLLYASLVGGLATYTTGKWWMFPIMFAGILASLYFFAGVSQVNKEG